MLRQTIGVGISDRVVSRMPARQYDLQTLPRTIDDNPRTVHGRQDRQRHAAADLAMIAAVAFQVQIVELDVVAAVIVEHDLDRRAVVTGSQLWFVGTGNDPAGLVIAVGTENDVIHLAVSTE